MKKLMTSLGFTWRPENFSTARNTKTQPSRWRTAWAAVALGVLALCTTITNAQVQWLSADVGGPTFKGSAVEASGQWTIQGGGSDIWNDSSQFHYLYVWASGNNWDCVAQFVSFAGPANWSKVELLVDQADPALGPQGTDPFIAMMDTQPSTVAAPDGSGNGVNDGGIDQWRSTANSASDWKQVGTTPAPNYPNDWFRIQRQTNIFNLFHSGDGINWTNYISIDTSSKTLIGQDASTTFGTPWPNLVCVGVAVTAHNDTWTDPDTGLPAGATAVVANLNTTNIAAATPPTLLAAYQQSIVSVTNVVGHEVSLMFAATNNATPAPAAYPVAYQWYKNNSAVPNATNTLYTWLLDVSDNGAQYYCKASLAAPYSSLTVNSATATFGTVPGVTYNNGFKLEMFAGVTDRTLVERGDVPPATWLAVEPNCDDPCNNYGYNYVTRVSGWFIPPTTDLYTFFVATDDDSDLFLNMTNSTIAGKQMIAQEVGWTGFDDWFSDSSTPSMQRSDQWTDATGNSPWNAGIPLTKGQPYYIENVHHQGGGGAEICVTYQTATMIAAGGGTPPNNTFANGTNSLFYATNNNMRYYSIPGTVLTWVTRPTNTTVTAGFAANFYSQAISDSEFTPVYQWYKNGTPYGAATPFANILTTPATTAADNGTTFYVVVSTAEGELSITSSVVTLNVSLPVLEYGWAKMEYWYANDIGLAPFLSASGTNYVDADTTSPDYVLWEPIFEGNSKDNLNPNYTSRLTALFYPPATGKYVFFVNSDDQSDLFVSTDSSPTNATLVAQETAWSNPWQWQSEDGNAASSPPPASKCSATWAAPNLGTPWANGIQMNAGQPYYVVLMHVDTGGGNNCEATFMTMSAWTASGDTGPANGSYSAMTGNLIGSYVPRCFSMTFSQEPTTAMVPIGGLATFSAAGVTDSKSAIGDEGNSLVETNNFVIYQWTKNGVAIAGANGSSYSFGPVYPIDTSAQFACTIRALGYVDSSGKDLWATSTIANIVLTGTNVFEPGIALHEFFGNNPPLANIENGTAGNPTWLMSSPAFELDVNAVEVADNFSDQLLGFFTPPTSGNYVFFVNADDTADLFLSTDGSASNKRMIAQATAWAAPLQWGTSSGVASQIRSDTFVDPATGLTLYSNGIPLVAGKQYFMQCTHGQGGGGTESCVTWVLTPGANNPPAAPANGTLSVIRGSQVGTYVPKCSYVTVTNNPQSVTVNNYASTTFTAGGETDSTVPIGNEYDWRPFFNNFLEFQWYKNNTAIAGASASAYTDSPILPSDNNAKVYCTMRALGYADSSGNILWQTSQVATLTVNITAPTLLYGAIYTNNNYVNFALAATNYIILAFSNPMDPGALNNMGNYTLPAGLTLLGVMVNSNDYRSVALAYSGTPTFPLNVTVSSSLAGLGGGPTLSGSTSIAVDKVPLTDMDIGQIPGTDPSVPGMMYVEGTNSYTIACEGSDIWNNFDGFNFAYETKTGDFDVVVRVKDVKHTSNWSKAGLMVRETLDADSRNWNIVNDPASADGIMAPDGSGYGANAIECNARVDKTGASAAWTTNDVSTVPAYPNAWVRLTRVGNILTAYFSTNNAESWTAAATNDPAVVSTTGAGELPATVYVGLCTTAHNNDAIPNPSPLVYLDTVDYANYNSSYVYVPPSNTTMKAHVSNGNIIITWTPVVGQLYASPAIAGPNVDWLPVAGGTTGSNSIPITGTGQFFRVR